MNTIYLTTRLLKTGPTNQAFNLTSAYKKLGHKCYLVCLSPEIESNSWASRFKEANIPIIRIDKQPWDIIGCIRSLKSIIKEYKIDLVHSSGFRADLCNVLLGDIVKHVSTQRNEIDETGEGRHYNKWVLKKIVQWMAVRFDKRVACSYSLADLCLKNHNLMYNVVQNSVDIDRYSVLAQNQKVELRKSLNLPLTAKIYVYLGILVPRKNIPLLIETFDKLSTNGLLVIVGGKQSEIDSLKRDRQENVLFVGFKSNPMEYLQCADYSISASLSEGLPNSVLESLACGIPVILSDIDQHKEILRVGNVGIEFQSCNVDSAVSAIHKINKSDYVEMVEACIEAANGPFSKYNMAKNYIKLYEKALS